SIETRFRDHRLRLATLSHTVIGAGSDSPITVTVGVTLGGHDAMVRRLWLSAFAQQLALVAIAGVFVLLGLRRGLAPLLRLRDAVRSPDRSDLDPVEVPGAQSEIRPLIDALNAYMERVRA
ncbi:HAMP domain-containing protein, partial [Mesorhizobium sp. M8A.F.Ca.ET.208.01.1.1]